MSKILNYAKSVKKALAGASAAVTVLVAAGLLTGDAKEYVVGGIAAVTAFIGVYLVPANEPVPEAPTSGTVNPSPVDDDVATASEAPPEAPTPASVSDTEASVVTFSTEASE